MYLENGGHAISQGQKVYFLQKTAAGKTPYEAYVNYFNPIQNSAGTFNAKALS